MYSKQLETFVRTADTGSFNKAAKELYITPASLIQQINSLENRLQLKLFTRNSRGVKLTEAGLSLYNDAKVIMHQADVAVEHARKLQNESQSIIRIGTSVLMKCRELVDICSRVVEMRPPATIELVALKNPDPINKPPLEGLGETFDIQEGLCLSEYYQDKGNFYKFYDVPLCAAIPKNHSLQGKEVISLEDLRGETVVTLIGGISSSFDSIRIILENCGDIAIREVPFYGFRVFSLCEIENRILISPSIWQDIHPNLVNHKLECEITIPYGLIYSDNLSPQCERFVEMVKASIG